jgi:hypothetical protein
MKMRPSGMRQLCAWAALIASACLAMAALAAPTGRYTVADGTVYDTKTKLTWQQTASSASYSFPEARDACAGLGATLGGKGWRVPTVKELLTIVDLSQSSPSIDTTAFPSFSPSRYWTATMLETPPVGFCLVDFGDGTIRFTATKATDRYLVLCVR